jgi:hypothetical protein
LVRDCDGYVALRHVDVLRPVGEHARAVLALPVGA